MPYGRIRKEIGKGWTSLVDGELRRLKVGVISLSEGEDYRLETQDMECACVLIYGECEVSLLNGPAGSMGPRRNPFEDAPYGIFATKGEEILFKAKTETMLGVGSAPAETGKKSMLITPEKTGGGVRGRDNWQREVRFVLWSDNTEGNMLIAGETCTPSGNWSTIPPHRHQYDIPGEEVPYEEVYFFQFSRPRGFGLTWQFDDEGAMDQAFSIRNNDVLYMDKGYHPAVCCPGTALYHLTFACGPHRLSKSRVHDDFRFLLEESNMENPYGRQFVGKNDLG